MSKAKGFLTEVTASARVSVRTDPITDSYAVEMRPFARGKFATVKRCRHIESGKDYAAKHLRKRRRSEDVRHELIHEAYVLAMAEQCPSIVHLKEVFETDTEVILVLEMAAGGELQHVLDCEDCLPECESRKLMVQICQGLQFLHKRNIAHLDIKPQNLLLTAAFPQGEAKLCDFGISRLILPGEEIFEIAGTPDYIAPEVLQYEPISLATDMWSLGILAYVLLTGHTPFGADSKQATYCNITLGELDFPQELFEDVSAEAVNFITQLVVKDPRKRISIDEALRHPWMTTTSSPMSISISSINGLETMPSLPNCDTPSTSSMGSCDSDNDMEVHAAGEVVADRGQAQEKGQDVEEVADVKQEEATTTTGQVAEEDSSDEERCPVAAASPSANTEDGLPTGSESPAPLRESRSLSLPPSSPPPPSPSLTSPEPIKGLPKSPLNFSSSLPKCPKELNGFSSPPSTTAILSSDAYHSPTLSPQLSPTLRRSLNLYSKVPSARSLTRSSSVSPVRTVSGPPKGPLFTSKSLSSALPVSNGFKYPQSTSLSSPPAKSKVPTASILPPVPKRTPSTNGLKRPQSLIIPSKSSKPISNTSCLKRELCGTSPKPSLLSPTVSSALKSCTLAVRGLGCTPVKRSQDCEVNGISTNLKRSPCSPIPSPQVKTSLTNLSNVKRNNGAQLVPMNGQSVTVLRRIPKSPGANVVRRSSLLERGTKSVPMERSRKSMDLDNLRRKLPFNDDMVMC